MLVARGLIVAAVLMSMGVAVSGCDTLDSLNLDFFDSKKKLPGERKPVFPEGVPGVSQGIPPEYQKGYNEQAQAPDPATTAVEQIAPQKEARPAPKPAPKPAAKPSPKPVVRQTQAPPPQPQPAQQPPQQQPQQSQLPGATPLPWPQQQPQAAWPAPPNPNQFSR